MLTVAEARQYVHLNRMDCHVVTLSVVVSSHFDAGDHPLEAVQRVFLAAQGGVSPWLKWWKTFRLRWNVFSYGRIWSSLA